MFHMMNEARLMVGMQGFTCASSAYMYAVNYARSRVQGRNLLKSIDQTAPGVPIIQHPDVRRMLMIMKSSIEGMRSLIYYVGYCTDRSRLAETLEEKTKYQGFVDLLTPVAKGYVTDRAFEICNIGLQIFGGYGYTKEFPLEQLVRDCRITQIYEGTNGIQAMDLLGRKLGMNRGKTVMDLMGEITKTIQHAKNIEGLESCAEKVENALKRLGEVAFRLGGLAMSPKVMNAFAFAHPLMEVCGDVVMAWMLLWRASIAAPKLEKICGGEGLGEGINYLERCAKIDTDKNAAFYEGVIKSAEFFIHTILPVTHGKMNSIMETNAAAVEIPEVAFGG